MIRFEEGRTYSVSSVGDHNAIWYYQIARRTEKSVWLHEVTSATDLPDWNQPEKRKKIDVFQDVETCFPSGHYSMAPILRATSMVNAMHLMADDEETKLEKLEAEGMTRSDAQGVLLAEKIRGSHRAEYRVSATVDDTEDVAALGLTLQELKELREVVRVQLEKGRHHPPHWDRHELHRSLAAKLDDLLAEVNHESKL